MSEQLESQPAGELQPIEPSAARRKPINIRKAMTGLRLLRGEGSLAECLRLSGYSPSTARAPANCALDANSCIDEAQRMNSDLSPARLLEMGRQTFADVLSFADPAKMRISEATRVLDVTEKYYGGHRIPDGGSAITVADRLAQLVSFLVVARERGLPVPSLPAELSEAKVVNGERTITENDEQKS